MTLLPVSRIILTALLMLGLYACTPQSTVQPAVPPKAAQNPTNAPLPATWTPSTKATGAENADANNTVTQGPLSVKLYGIADQQTVGQSSLALSGTADPQTVISFNDQIVSVGAEGKYSVPLTLAEGPNVIEITASDSAGNQGTLYLTVVYDPQP